MRLRTLPAALAVWSLPAAALAAPSIAAVDEVVAPYVGRDAPGIGVLVLRGGKVLHRKGYGLADMDSETPVDENTVFDLASVSKEMTGLAAMMLISDGTIAPDTGIGEVLPAFEDAETSERAITVSDLAHHVGGLPDYLGGDEDLGYGAETTNAQVIDWLARQPPERPPGTAFDYSNSGYLVLGSLVAVAAGAPSLRDVLQARVWSPLGMRSTGLVELADGVDPARRASGYKGRKGRFEPSFTPTATEGDGNVLSTLADLSLYEAALAGGTLLDEAATAALFTNGTFDDGRPVTQRDDDPDGYSYGWMLGPAEAPVYAYHSGSWDGTSTYYQRNLETGVTVIVLANGEDMASDELAEAVEEAVE